MGRDGDHDGDHRNDRGAPDRRGTGGRRSARLVAAVVVAALAVAGGSPASAGGDAKTRHVVVHCDAKDARIFVGGEEWPDGQGDVPANRGGFTVTALVTDCAPVRKTVVPKVSEDTVVDLPAPKPQPWPNVVTTTADVAVGWDSVEFGWFDGPKVPPGDGRPVLGRAGLTTQFLDRRHLGSGATCVADPGPWTPRTTVLDLLDLPEGTEVRLDGARVEDGAQVAPGKHTLAVGPASRPRKIEIEVAAAQPVVRLPVEVAHRPVVEKGAAWIVRHQRDDGRWSSAGFDCGCTPPCAPGAAGHDVGVTGLALLALLGADDAADGGAYAQPVAKGLAFLLRSQDEKGWFQRPGTRSAAFGQPIAELAVLEAWSRSGDAKLEGAARRGLGAILEAHNPYLAWRYGLRDGDNDTAVTGWMALAVSQAMRWDLERAPFGDLRGRSPRFRRCTDAESSLMGAVAWLDKMTDPETGRVGYQNRGGPRAYHDLPLSRYGFYEDFQPCDWSLTSVALLARRRIDALVPSTDAVGAALVEAGLRGVAENPPFGGRDPDAFADVHAAWFGARLLRWPRGRLPYAWDEALDALAARQRPDGGFPPDRAWSPEGGAVYTTAMAVLALE